MGLDNGTGNKLLICGECGKIHEKKYKTDLCECGGNLKTIDGLICNDNNLTIISDETMICKRCGSQNPDDAVFCIECGDILKESEIGKDLQTETTKTELITKDDRGFCGNCKFQNPDNALFCMECGQKLEGVKQETIVKEDISTKCPFCSEKIKSDAIKCKHCGEWLNKHSMSQYENQIPQYSNAQPIGRLLPALLLSFGLYIFYWYYKNWKHLKNHKNLDISPGGRTVLLIIPIVGYFMLYEQFNDIKNYAKENRCKTYSSGLLVLVFFVISVCLFWVPFVGVLFIWPIIVVQETLNEYWRAEQPNLPVKNSFTDGELLTIILGGIIIFLVIMLYILAFIGSTQP